MIRGYARGPWTVWPDRPLQAELNCPWRVAVASMLLCQTRRQQAEPVLMELLRRYPTLGDLARADGLEELVKPCGLHRNRARALQRMSVKWTGEDWCSVRELPGVGAYVADAVGLFCFNLRDLESTDHVLRGWAER